MFHTSEQSAMVAGLVLPQNLQKPLLALSLPAPTARSDVRVRLKLLRTLNVARAVACPR